MFLPFQSIKNLFETPFLVVQCNNGNEDFSNPHQEKTICQRLF